MPLSAISLLNTTGIKSFKTEKAIPDYSVLFWHRIHDWNDVNSVHGDDPSAQNSRSKIFRQYEIGEKAIPDIVGQHSDTVNIVNDYNYVVRCVSSSSSWPLICDLRYDVNTSISYTESTLLDVGGAHGYNLLGRVAPPLKNNFELPYSSDIDYNVYTNIHYGHIHQSEGIYNKLISIDSGDTYNILNNNIYTPSTFASFFVDPIIKDPRLKYVNVKTIPKDIIVMYYGIDTLSLDHYDPYDLPVTQTENNIDFSASGYILPITMVQTSTTLEVGKVGAKNINNTTTKNNLANSIDIVGSKFANSISFIVSSNTSGFHDHKTGMFGRISTKPDLTYNVITEQNKTTIFPNNLGEQFTNGPDPVSHVHKITYTFEVKLKERKLKAFLSKASNAPIQNGLIIGYSIGKYSKFGGDRKTGKENLPVGWYFCDGQHGTPDLRGKYPFLNFKNDINTIDNTTSTIEVTDINVETINWQHGHVYKSTPNLPVQGAGGAKDSGSHSSNYDNDGDPNRTTRHTHDVSTKDTFIDGNLNTKVGTTFDYEPPTVEIAFIMYNDTI
jgi:hypothetical protein